MSWHAVIFDLGGVVVGSPLHAIRDYEREIGIPVGSVDRVVVDTAPSGAWSRLERGELAMEAFFDAFEADCARAGHRLDARVMMARIAEVSQPRPLMLRAIDRIRSAGLGVAALTNNWATEGSQGSEGDNGSSSLRPLFDVFVESSVEGLRKPDPRIYHLACERLSVRPDQTVFLDDIGSNLKSARALGMHTIKVEEPREALTELETVLALPLLDAEDP